MTLAMLWHPHRTTDWNLPKYLSRRNHQSLVFAWVFSWSKWEGTTAQARHLQIRYCTTWETSLGIFWTMDLDCSFFFFLHKLDCWCSHLPAKYFFVLLSSAGKVLLLSREWEPPHVSSDWECSCSPRSEVFFQLHPQLKNVQGKHFYHLCLQIMGDISLHVHWELGSPGSLSGMPTHWKTIPCLTLVSLLWEEDSFSRCAATGKKPIICHRGLCRAVLVTKEREQLREMTFRVFPKKEISSEASWHGAYGWFS